MKLCCILVAITAAISAATAKAPDPCGDHCSQEDSLACCKHYYNPSTFIKRLIDAIIRPSSRRRLRKGLQERLLPLEGCLCGTREM